MTLPCTTALHAKRLQGEGLQPQHAYHSFYSVVLALQALAFSLEGQAHLQSRHSWELAKGGWWCDQIDILHVCALPGPDRLDEW